MNVAMDFSRFLLLATVLVAVVSLAESASRKEEPAGTTTTTTSSKSSTKVNNQLHQSTLQSVYPRLANQKQQQHLNNRQVGQNWKLPYLWHKTGPSIVIQSPPGSSGGRGGTPQYGPPDIHLSRDGMTLTTSRVLNESKLIGRRSVFESTTGIHISSYTYTDERIRQWIPLGEFIIWGDDVAAKYGSNNNNKNDKSSSSSSTGHILPASYMFEMAYGRDSSMAVLTFGFESLPMSSSGPIMVDLQVYIRDQSPWVSGASAWIPLGPSIDPNTIDDDEGDVINAPSTNHHDKDTVTDDDSNPDKTQMIIRGVAIADDVDAVPEGLIVATNLVPMVDDFDAPNVTASIQVYTPQVVQPPDDDPDALPTDVEWIPFGGPIKGNNVLFGMSMEMNVDGSVLAVTGSYDLPDPDSDDDSPGNLSCFIRTYEFDPQEGWVQMGSDIKLQKDPYTMFCPDITLSGDGSTIATGVRGYEEGCPHHPIPHGHVQVWYLRDKDWVRKGPDLESFFPVQDDDSDVFFGQFKGLSHDGDRIVLSVMEGVDLKRAKDSTYTYYVNTMNWKDGNWTQKDGNTVGVGQINSFAIDDTAESLAVGSFLYDVSMSGLVDTYHYYEQHGEQKDDDEGRVIVEEATY